MSTFSGKCLCGEISYATDSDAKMIANCHCTDCRTATGSAYATLAFFPASDVVINGTPQTYSHVVDSGNTLTKHFCSTCGSQMFGENSAREGMIAIRAGSVEQSDAIKPAFNVYVSSKIGSTPLDPDLPAHDKMPG